jgi:hypothetical protein
MFLYYVLNLSQTSSRCALLLLKSGHFCDEDLDIDHIKRHINQEDFASAVTIGTGHLPAPNMGEDLKSNYEEE